MNTITMRARFRAPALILAVFGLFLFSAATASAAPNLIANPGLEASTTVATLPDHWSQGGYGTNTATLNYQGVAGHTGKGVSVTVTNYVSGDAKWYFTPVAVEGGAFYTFSDWYKTATTTYLVVVYTGGDSEHPDRSITIATLPATNPAVNGGWAQASSTFAAYSGYTSMTVYHIINSNGTLTTDDHSLELTAPASQTIFDKGIVSLTFDDGWDTQRTNALPRLDDPLINFKATFYIVGKVIRDLAQTPGSGYFGSSTMRSIQAAGHEIGDHTENHCNLALLAASENSNTSNVCAFPAPGRTYQEEIDDGDESVRNAGATAINTLGYPNGATNEQIKQYLQSNPSLIGARTITEGYNTKQADRYALQVHVVSRDISLDTIKGWIDTAVANKFWLILVFHQIDSEATLINTAAGGGTTPEKFDGMLNHLKSKGSNVEVLTVRDALSRMGVTPPPTDTTAPIITLTGSASTSVTVNTVYTDAGAAASDTTDGNISANIVVTGTVATSTVGTYILRYNVNDAAGNPAVEVTRTVNVIAPAPADPTCSANQTLVNHVCVDNQPAPSTPAPAGGNGGGGGGGGIVGSGPLSLGYVFVNPSRPITTTGGQVLGAATCFIFTKNLSVGSTGTEVTQLQTRLASEGLFSAGATGYFGSVTKAATVAYQKKNGIQALGNTGPKTRAALNATCTPAPAVPAATSTGSVLGTTTFMFTKTLALGSSGLEVNELQKVLIALGFLKVGAPTGYFGKLTRLGVIDYQVSRGIEAAGIVGPKTRAALSGAVAGVSQEK